MDERIPMTRLESWKEFADLLNDPFFNRPGVELVFRGHRRYDWSLTPSLGRLTETGIISKETAETQLERFRRAVRGRLDDHSLVEDDQKDELWSVGQHHGLMTPLLDWTYAPYVALFFAFGSDDPREEKEKSPNPYRAVYVLNKSFVNNDAICPDIRVIEPRKDDHGRLVNQAGLFTYSPLDSTIEDTLANTLSADSFPDDALRNADEDEQAEVLARYICKIYIKNDDREGCLRHLWLMNVHHASLFPDLQGAAEYCNGQIGFKSGFEAAPAPVVADEPEDEPEPEDVTPHPIAPAVGIEVPQTETLPAVASVPAVIDVPTLESILWECMGSFKAGPERIAKLAADLARDLPTAMVVDWEKRDSGIARVRLFIRQMLRTHHYPAPLLSLAVDCVVGYLRGMPSPDFIAATRAAEASAPSPEQIKRQRDVEQLRNVFHWIHLGVMGVYIERLGQLARATNAGVFMYERLRDLLANTRFYLSDKELRKRIDEFVTAFGNTQKYAGKMVHGEQEAQFPMPGDIFQSREQEKQVNYTLAQAEPLRKALEDLKAYVAENYVEIDLATSGEDGFKEYEEYEALI